MAKEIYGDVKVHVTGCDPRVSQVIFGDIEVVTGKWGPEHKQVLAAPCQDWPLPGLEILSKRTLEMITEKSEVECNLLAVADRPLTDEDFLPPVLDVEEAIGDIDIVLCDGFSKADVKRWEAKSWPYYENLAELFLRAGKKVASVGSPGEYVPGTLDLTGLSFEESLGVVKKARLLISNDTGMYHAANLVGTQNLAIFTFTDLVKNFEKRFHLYSDAVRLDLECSPCMKGIGGEAVWLERKPWCGWRCRQIPFEHVFNFAMKKLEIEEKRMKRMTDVAAYVATLEEGPFLEEAIKTVSPMVDKVFVVECMSTWSGSELERRGMTRAIVDKCGLENVEYVENPVGREGSTPAECETAQRQWALDMINEKGYKWVWWVDADEVYEPSQAKALWDWFRTETVKRPDVLGARTTWWTYWRSMKWVVYPPEPYHPTIIIRSSCRLREIRVMSPEDERKMLNVPPEVCMVHHFSWAKRPEEIRKKISCWGHADQLVQNWYDDKFDGWMPGEGSDFHPTVPNHYQTIKRAESLVAQGHPWSRKEVIEDVRIMVVILNHNRPENTDRLATELRSCFPEVEVWDSGSGPDGVPISLTESFGNIYWEGAWLEAMRRYGDYDVVWLLGCDIILKDSPEKYRQAIESSVPFGCWSPGIDGRAHDFMLAGHYAGRRERVLNVEGMALAVSGELIRAIGAKFEVETKIGFGQDYWLCASARKMGLPNYIDGAVTVVHPAEIGYNESDAHDKMEKVFSEKFGRDFRRTLFEYSSNFQGNLFKEISNMSDGKLTIVTADNGWGVKEFERVTEKFKDCRRVIMAKGISDFSQETTAEVIPYDEEMTEILKGDIALFTRVGAANQDEYFKLLAAGIPVVVHTNHSKGKISHQEDGFVYGDETWASGWVKLLIEDEGLRLRVGGLAAKRAGGESKSEEPEPEPEPQPEPSPASESSDIKVTVITPTYRRDPKVVSRCINCVRLQTVANIEQLVCSDGAPESQIASLVGSLGDERITYHHTTVKKPGDFGNTVRAEMLKKARGEYVLFMDDDNIILPDYLEQMIKAIEDSGKDFAVCRVVHFGPLNEEQYGKKPPVVLTGLPVKLYHVDPLQILVKRGAMQEVGWDTEKGYLADGHTLQALGDKFEHVEVPVVLGFHM
jgi:GT2 family glycosyltransferase